MTYRLPFKLEKQETPCLCWAAIGASLVRYYRPDQPIDQRTAVITVLGSYQTIPTNGRLALERLGVLRQAVDAPINPEGIRRELDLGRVIVIRHDSPIGANHLLAISGMDSAGRLWIDNPRNDGGWHTYSEVLGARDLWYEWKATFLTAG